MLKGTTLKPKLNYRLNLRIDVTVKKDKTIRKFFGVLADRCGSVVVRERYYDTNGPSLRSRFDLGLRFSIFLIETISITDQNLSVLTMAATVYERDNCTGDILLGGNPVMD